MTNTQSLTTTDLDAMTERDDFGGWGYLGERDRAFEAVQSGEWAPTAIADIAAADYYVLRVAAERGWDAERLFEWANSKDGRWFADTAIGCRDLARAARYI